MPKQTIKITIPVEIQVPVSGTLFSNPIPTVMETAQESGSDALYFALGQNAREIEKQVERARSDIQYGG